MTEEKKFQKTRYATREEIIDAIDDYNVLTMHELKPNTHIDVKFLENVEIREREEYDPVYTLMCEVSLKGCDPTQIKVRVSGGAVKRFQKKNEETGREWIGKHGRIAKTKYDKSYPQFVMVFDKELDRRSKDDMFKKKTKTVSEPQPDTPSLSMNIEIDNPGMSMSMAEPEQKSLKMAPIENPDMHIMKVIDFMSKNKDVFVSNFCTDDVVNGTALPQAFIDWYKTSDGPQIPNKEEHTDEDIAKIFWTIYVSVVEQVI